jgi:hypothetical protein
VPKNLKADVCNDHRILFESFGGINETLNEPGENWLQNLNSSLTMGNAMCDASFIEDYSELFEMDNCDIPINLSEYYSLAIEANRNTTICHKENGNILLFAPDHCFSHIEVYPGSPEYTLYTYKEAHSMREWVENVARQWLA